MRCMPRFLVLRIGLVLLLFSPLASANKAILDVLYQNGTITKAQYHALLSSLKEEADSKAMSAPSAAPSSVPDSQQAKLRVKGGIEAESPDGEFAFKLGGRIQLDAGAPYEDDDGIELKPSQALEFRRIRLFAKGVMFRDWGFKSQVDFEGNEVTVKDMYLRYLPWNLYIGQFKQPFSLESLTSSRFMTFMERGLPNSFATDRRIGVGHFGAWNEGGWKRLGYAVSLYGQEMGADNEAVETAEGLGVGGRAWYGPQFGVDGRDLLHVGLAAAHEQPSDRQAATVRFRSRPEAHWTDTRYVDTGTIHDVENIDRLEGELAAVLGPLSLQSEYMRVSLPRKAGADRLDFDGWYAYASWFITGEQRPYDLSNGAFGRVKPKNKAYGAWEVGLRYSSIDLDSGEVEGGRQSDWTLGLNWYVNPHQRFMLNATWIDADSYREDERTGDLMKVVSRPGIIQARVSLDF